MGEYFIKVLDSTEYDRWDKFVDLSPQGTIFHKSYWLKASEVEFKVYGCFNGDDLIGGLPLAYKSLFGITRATQPPFTPYCGILYRNSTAKYVSRISDEKRIATLMAKRIKKDFQIINFRFAPSVTDLQPFIWEGFSSSVEYTYFLDVNNLILPLMLIWLTILSPYCSASPDFTWTNPATAT